MTTTTERSSHPEVPLPSGAKWDGDWNDEEPPYVTYRIIHGRDRVVGGPIEHFGGHTTGLAEVETSACQLIDGTLEVDDPPQIQVHVYRDIGLNPEEARQVAALLLEAADEIEGWVA